MDRRSLKVQALFGGGKNKQAERDEAFQAQMRLIEERKNGAQVSRASERRAKIQQDERDKMQKQQARQEALRRGEIEDYKGSPYGEDDPKSGIIIPIIPIGIPKFDNGERFDLKGPWVSEGWWDEKKDKKDGEGVFGFVKNIFGKKKEDNKLVQEDINDQQVQSEENIGQNEK